jgi:hypothetical protein
MYIVVHVWTYRKQKWFSIIVKPLKEQNLDPAVNVGKIDLNKQNTFLVKVWQMDY